MTKFKYLNPSNFANLQELKRAYKKLAVKLHPDHGGDVREMQILNDEYENAAHILSLKADATNGENRQFETAAQSAAFIKAMDKLMKVPGLELEVCGTWIWISGNTMPVKDQLKEAGCYWQKAKKKWYWMPGKKKGRRVHHNIDMERIRAKYGSEKFKSEGVAAIA